MGTAARIESQMSASAQRARSAWFCDACQLDHERDELPCAAAVFEDVCGVRRTGCHVAAERQHVEFRRSAPRQMRMFAEQALRGETFWSALPEQSH